MPEAPHGAPSENCETCGDPLDDHTHDTAVECAMKAQGRAPAPKTWPNVPTWADMTEAYPSFVQWAVQKYGPLPAGPIQREDYDRLAEEYLHV